MPPKLLIGLPADVVQYILLGCNSSHPRVVGASKGSNSSEPLVRAAIARVEWAGSGILAADSRPRESVCAPG